METVSVRPLTIGQVARRAEVGIELLRLDERQGLLDEPARKESGYRQYAADVWLAQLRFIKRAKDLGFSLTEIKERLAVRSSQHKLRGGPPQSRGESRGHRGKDRDSPKDERALKKLTVACGGRGPVAQCPSRRRMTSNETRRHGVCQSNQRFFERRTPCESGFGQLLLQYRWLWPVVLVWLMRTRSRPLGGGGGGYTCPITVSSFHARSAVR